MSLAIDQPIHQKPLSFDEFLARYGGDNRYELIGGLVGKIARVRLPPM